MGPLKPLYSTQLFAEMFTASVGGDLLDAELNGRREGGVAANNCSKSCAISCASNLFEATYHR